jgi:hypothetical protein
MVLLFLCILIGGAFVIAVLGSDMAGSSWPKRPNPQLPGDDGEPGNGDPSRSGPAANDVEMPHGKDQ